ncbi:hypothetical protein FACS1894152_0580 [Bacilli bacterium]|nr:hypothetical protein FACS1894152_0580 [Bacilli bacterium]
MNKLLLAPYSIVGKVITGKRQGHKLGYPTANVMLSQECIPPMDGSYYGYTYVNNVKYRSAIFVRGRLIETHIFNFNKNIYGDVITIEFKKFDKKPSKSTSFDHLKMMLDKKIKLIKASF